MLKNNNLLKRAKRVHFIGIGGIAISAIARMMLMEGKKVSGSDSSSSIITKELKRLGAKIFLGHNASHIKSNTDLVIYTLALSPDNPELKKSAKLEIPTLSYPEALGLISKDKYTIAVSGAHGKTTTTAMIGKILLDAKKEPTIVVGSLLKKQNSNFVAGRGEYFVCEACEYKESFLNLSPKIIVITNIDNDHLDYYKNLDNIKKAFAKFAGKLNKNNFLVCSKKDSNLKEVIKKTKARVFDYAKVSVKGLKLKIPGEHNIKNAQTALAVARILKISPSISLKALNNFTGTWRRFEYKGRTRKGVLVYDDYGHHPTEIKATLKAAREFLKNKKLWCVFQPHLYSRTKLLIKDFAKSFGDADYVIVADIYAAREKEDKRINGKKLAQAIKKHNPNTRYIKSFNAIEKFLRKSARKGDVVITMGAGDIFKAGENLLKK